MAICRSCLIFLLPLLPLLVTALFLENRRILWAGIALAVLSAAFQSRLRLAVVAALMTGEKDFTALTKLTEATPGNLGRQMELLEADGLVSCKKELYRGLV